MALTGIAGISLVAAAPASLERFYCDALGFRRMRGPTRIAHGLGQLYRADAGNACTTLLRIGGQRLELLTFDKPGRPYPPDVAGNDLRFQHFAIVVADMQVAYGRLQAHDGWAPITHPVPQNLPASSGGVTAFKFRDPEGHPLELLAFPPGKLPFAYRQHQHDGVCLAIDHSAISVADTARSTEFYAQMAGFGISGHSLNSGIEQERLDGLNNPVVEVTALSSAKSQPPHLELLCYRNPAPCPPGVPLACNDVAATKLIMEKAPDDQTQTALVHDPDGHAILLTPYWTP